MPVSIVALGPVARRSFWTLGKVALRAVVAHREPASRGCDDGMPLWEVGRQALGGVEEMTEGSAWDHVSVVASAKVCNSLVTSDARVWRHRAT